jgi:cellulose synthase/poly-beta-1,6-N-acetylglucosamine synthase-like glycosyltransferase
MPRPLRPAAAPPEDVTFIVPAHDEEQVIEAKLRNVLDCSPRPARLSVVVASDGSTDATVARARAVSSGGVPVSVLDLPRLGKARALNAAVEAATGDVLVFSDANAMLERGSLAALLAPFADTEVGGVAGNQRYRQPQDPKATAAGESSYWSWDTWLKTMESRIGSCYAADGSLHALRRDLYVPVEDPAQADDMAISMRVATAGRRLVLAPDAVAWEDAPQQADREWRRKARVTNHSLRSLLLLGRDLWTSGFYSFELVSHKLLRHLGGYFLAVALLASAVAAPGSRWAAILLALQLAFYAAATAGYFLSLGGRAPRLLVLPWYFCLANAAAMVGSAQALFGRRIVGWRPDREPSLTPPGTGPRST